MQILGFGGTQLAASPQVFQSLAIGAASPSPPAAPWGTPNARLVPVKLTATGTIALNLTLAALPTATLVAALLPGAGEGTLGASVSRPPIDRPGTT